MRYTTDTTAFGSWQPGSVTAGTPTTTLYGIAARNAKNVVIAGSRGSGTDGVIAACSVGGAGTCGSTALTLVASAPAADMRDVAYVSGGGDNVYAVGTGGNAAAGPRSRSPRTWPRPR